MQKALDTMERLEKGELANPDENRLARHYWLRNPAMPPSQEIRQGLEQTVKSIEEFAGKIHRGEIAGAGGKFKNLLLIGIGGSALGPHFVSNALSQPTTDKLRIYFIDNTAPDGMNRVLATIGEELSRTLCIVISKSGRTKETRNGMLEAGAAYSEKGLAFSAHAVAVTCRASALDKHAESNHWLCRFPMWDWVGGRTSKLSAVGLLPAALQGFTIRQMLNGARSADETMRQRDTLLDSAAKLATARFSFGNDKVYKHMAVLRYKDRLEVFSRYLQQLLMECLGKEFDTSRIRVNQSMSVYENNESTDQHAYVHQLMDGVNNCFAVCIQVLSERLGRTRFVDDATTSANYLNGFFWGTREPLYAKWRQSVTITVRDVTPFSIGVLIALFERAVGLYASLVSINAYHQPRVEAGKKAAEAILDLQAKIVGFLSKIAGRTCDVAEIDRATNPDCKEELLKICQHLASNPNRGVRADIGKSHFETRYSS